jgi:glycosyltransferase involved in cell wall biosynthesis
MKKPLVVAASQGPAAYVKDRENGMLVPVDDVEALRGAIQEVLDDTNLAAHIVRGGTKDYNQTFSRDAFVRLAKEFYGKLLAGEPIAP